MNGFIVGVILGIVVATIGVSGIVSKLSPDSPAVEKIDKGINHAKEVIKETAK